MKETLTDKKSEGRKKWKIYKVQSSLEELTFKVRTEGLIEGSRHMKKHCRGKNRYRSLMVGSRNQKKS